MFLLSKYCLSRYSGTKAARKQNQQEKRSSPFQYPLPFHESRLPVFPIRISEQLRAQTRFLDLVHDKLVARSRNRKRRKDHDDQKHDQSLFQRKGIIHDSPDHLEYRSSCRLDTRFVLLSNSLERSNHRYLSAFLLDRSHTTRSPS